jgi:hypothetical protein
VVRCQFQCQFSDRLDMLRVGCRKCERAGQYRVARLIARYGPDAGLPDFKDAVTADCPLRAQPALWNLCGVHFPDLAAVITGER